MGIVNNSKCTVTTKEVCFDVAGTKHTLIATYTTTGEGVTTVVFTDANAIVVNTTGGTVTVGACTIPVLDVFRVTQPLVVGNNVITHGLGRAPVEVEVRNNANGALISARVFGETTTTVTINVAVAVALARISIDT